MGFAIGPKARGVLQSPLCGSLKKGPRGRGRRKTVEGWQQRFALMVGEEKLQRLGRCRVAVLGLGGVGGSAAEALVRSGVGSILVVDNDVVEPSNLNRQLLATGETVGQPKCQVAKERFLSINPQLELVAAQEFYLPENRDFLFDYRPHYIVDCIDTVTAKLDVITCAHQRGIPVITCFGTGGRMDPSQLRVGDVKETAGSGCPLARIMRRELKRRGIERQDAVFSLEPPRQGWVPGERGRHSPGSSPFVPPAAGYLMASFVVNRLLEGE